MIHVTSIVLRTTTSNYNQFRLAKINYGHYFFFYIMVSSVRNIEVLFQKCSRIHTSPGNHNLLILQLVVFRQTVYMEI